MSVSRLMVNDRSATRIISFLSASRVVKLTVDKVIGFNEQLGLTHGGDSAE